MSSATLIPATVDEHPHVQRHTQRRRELDEKQGRAKTRRDTLVAEQTQLRRAQHEAAVAEALGDGAGVPDDPGRPARLAALEGEISAAVAELAALHDAIERLKVLEAQGREQAQSEIHQQLVAASRGIVKDMFPLVRKLQTLNNDLIALHGRSGGAVTLPTPVDPGCLEWFLNQQT